MNVKDVQKSTFINLESCKKEKFPESDISKKAD
jgi:hypothetical protein